MLAVSLVPAAAQTTPRWPEALAGRWAQDSAACRAGASRRDLVNGSEGANYVADGTSCAVRSLATRGEGHRAVLACPSGTQVLRFEPVGEGRFLVELADDLTQAVLLQSCAPPREAIARTGTSCTLSRGNSVLAAGACEETRTVSGRGANVGYRFADGTTVSVLTEPGGRIIWDGRIAERDEAREGCITAGADSFCAVPSGD